LARRFGFTIAINIQRDENGCIRNTIAIDMITDRVRSMMVQSER